MARDLGRSIALREHGLVFGGGNIGLMGELAQSVHEHGGNVFGVIHEALRELGLAYEESDDLVITKTLRERKQRMEDEATAFIALPGGIGTLEEVLEIVALKQLGYHRKPIVWLNHDGYFDPILGQLDRAVELGFARPDTRDLYLVASTVDEALSYIESYVTLEDGAPEPISRVAGDMLETME